MIATTPLDTADAARSVASNTALPEFSLVAGGPL
jgi:hypothetical protein